MSQTVRRAPGMQAAAALIAALCAFLYGHSAAGGVDWAYISPTNTEMSDLVAGASGAGYLVYYVSSRGIEAPSLVVELRRSPASDVAVARVYDAPHGSDHVPITIVGDDVRIDVRGPTLVIRAIGGWWHRDGVTNYDLDIEVRDGVYAVWGPTSWMQRVTPGQLAAVIRVRDEEGDGMPSWDLRRLIPFTQDGYYHASYAERRCDGPLEVDLGVTPTWPFVASPIVDERNPARLRPAGGLQQVAGHMRPPIVVDWYAARIAFLSEFVTLRNQSCSYGFYSDRPLREGQLNDLDFETPFAFYDLRQARSGFPDLIIRTVYSPAKLTVHEHVPRDFQEGTRYSWRVDDRPNWDLHFDYKVELAGFHPFDDETEIAGGLASITAPPYDEYPAWLIDRTWPLVTFVDTEGQRYRSSEGIYEWSTRDIDLGYMFGDTDTFQLKREFWGIDVESDPYQVITTGLRGEYRVGPEAPPLLYFSPLSNRLHLQGARAGVHDLGADGRLLSENLADGDFLDAWTLHGPRGVQRLLALDGYLLHATDATLSIKAADVPGAQFTILPPTDGPTWHAFSESVKATGERRDASDIRQWYDAFDGPEWTLEGARVVHVWGDRWHLHAEVALVDTARVDTRELDLFGPLDPGAQRVVLTFDRSARAWTIAPRIAPSLRGALEPLVATVSEPVELRLTLANRGNVELEGYSRLIVDGITIARWTTYSVPPTQTVVERLPWIPFRAGSFDVAFEIGRDRLDLGVLEVEAPRRVDPVTAFVLSAPGPGRPVAVLGVLALTLVVTGAALVHVRTRIPP